MKSSKKKPDKSDLLKAFKLFALELLNFKVKFKTAIAHLCLKSMTVYVLWTRKEK